MQIRVVWYEELWDQYFLLIPLYDKCGLDLFTQKKTLISLVFYPYSKMKNRLQWWIRFLNKVDSFSIHHQFCWDFSRLPPSFHGCAFVKDLQQGWIKEHTEWHKPQNLSSKGTLTKGKAAWVKAEVEDDPVELMLQLAKQSNSKCVAWIRIASFSICFEKCLVLPITGSFQNPSASSRHKQTSKI